MRRSMKSRRSKWLPRFSLVACGTVFSLFLWYSIMFSFVWNGQERRIMTEMPTWKQPDLADVFAWLDTFPGHYSPKGIGDTLLNKEELCISTESEEVVQCIRQGIGHLHNFHPFEAMLALRRGLRKGGQCCSLYWGMLMAMEYNKGFSLAAQELITSDNSKHCIKQDIINRDDPEAMGVEVPRASKNQILFSAWAQSNVTRRIEILSDAVLEFPKDGELKLFFAMELISATARSILDPEPHDRLRAVKILESILISNPNNPAVNHYWIHAWEDTNFPELALPHAKILPLYAPDAPHFTHMPGHIYHRMGSYIRAAEAFGDSFRVDAAYLADQELTPRYHWEYTHNLAYYADMLASSGQVDEAIHISLLASDISNIRILPSDKLFPLNMNPAMSTSVGHYFYQGIRSVPFVYARYGKWIEASKSLDPILKKLQDMKEAPDMKIGILYLQTLRLYFSLRHNILSFHCDDSYGQQEVLSQMIRTLESHTENFYLKVNVEVLRLWQTESLALQLAYCENEFEDALALMDNVVYQETQLTFAEPPQFPYPSLLSKGDVFRIMALHFDDEDTYKKLAADAYIQVLQREPHYPFAHYKAAATLKFINTTLSQYHFGEVNSVWSKMPFPDMQKS